MKKILVMIPHGEVYNHNCVRAYDYRDINKTVHRYYNMGDLFVYDSSLKLLEYDYVEPLKISEFSQEHIDRYNAEFDYCFLRGSNYLHPYMQWEQAVPVLEKLKIPVIPFGIGAQAPKAGELQLSDTTIRVMKLMADSCTRVGVRGTYTAEILHNMGIDNVDIIGCPTLYRNNNPSLSITLPPLEEVKNVGYSLRREVSSSYSDSVENYLQVQRDMIFEMNERFDLTLMAQGETEEKKIFYRFEDLIPKAIENLIALKWLQNDNDPMLDIYYNQMFYSETVKGYEDIVRTLDLVLGYRLHGNLIALANGTPAIYCTYDSRTREFADTYQIPCYDVDSGEKFILEDYYQQELFDQFNRQYSERYYLMSDFLTKNGIVHVMEEGRREAA